MGINQAFKM